VIHSKAGDWRAALTNLGLAPDANQAVVETKIKELGLNHRFWRASGNDMLGTPREVSHAEVWDGKRPRKPEDPFGEAVSSLSIAQALAEALGKCLVARDASAKSR
jgi:hypothetical protein